jgi:hypothetical protein
MLGKIYLMFIVVGYRKSNAVLLNFCFSSTHSKSIKELELEVKEAAAKSAENRANAISLSNLIVKQTRIKYFLERMKLVHQMLERQTAVDKLLLNFMSVICVAIV